MQKEYKYRKYFIHLKRWLHFRLFIKQKVKNKHVLIHKDKHNIHSSSIKLLFAIAHNHLYKTPTIENAEWWSSVPMDTSTKRSHT